MEQVLKYNEEELMAILQLLNTITPAPGKESLIRMIQFIEKTEKMIEEVRDAKSSRVGE